MRSRCPPGCRAAVLGAVLALSGAAVAANDGQVAAGETLYQENCIDCHMEDAAGDDIAPDIRGIPKNNLRRAMGGFDAMPEFDLSDREQAALLVYLKSLDD